MDFIQESIKLVQAAQQAMARQGRSSNSHSESNAFAQATASNGCNALELKTVTSTHAAAKTKANNTYE